MREIFHPLAHSAPSALPGTGLGQGRKPRAPPRSPTWAAGSWALEPQSAACWISKKRLEAEAQFNSRYANMAGRCVKRHPNPRHCNSCPKEARKTTRACRAWLPPAITRYLRRCLQEAGPQAREEQSWGTVATQVPVPGQPESPRTNSCHGDTGKHFPPRGEEELELVWAHGGERLGPRSHSQACRWHGGGGGAPHHGAGGQRGTGVS